MKKEEKQVIINIALEELIKQLAPRFNDFLFYNKQQRKEKYKWYKKAIKLLDEFKSSNSATFGC